MHNEIHHVVDIETLATTEDALVLSIGLAVVAVDGADIGTIFSAEWRIGDDSVQQGRRIEYDTVKWWATQCEHAARAQTFGRSQTSVISAFRGLLDAVEPAENYFIWGNAPDFDMRILRHLEKSFGGVGYLASSGRSLDDDAVFPYWTWRDVRTARMAMPDKLPRYGIEHTAIADAEYEAECVVEFLKRRSL